MSVQQSTPTRTLVERARSTQDSIDILGPRAAHAVEVTPVRHHDDGGMPMVVYSLPDGYLLTANEAARSMFESTAHRWDQSPAEDFSDPIDVRHTFAALAGLGGTTLDSYRARRTLTTTEGPVELLASVRRLVVGDSELAVVLAVPVHPGKTVAPTIEDRFAAAFVAGTIDAHGVVGSVSAAISPMETELIGALSESLKWAAHPDDAGRVDAMLESMRVRGSATGSFRVPHSTHGWVLCRCRLFTIDGRRHETNDGSPIVAFDSYTFVLSADVSTRSLTDRIARLERHIRRIGSEVHTADVDLNVRPIADRTETALLNSLELTARQRDIVERLARGQRVSSIAAALFINGSTVRNHLSHVFQLVGVHSQDELLIWMRAVGQSEATCGNRLVG